jgi:putative FmdB family regulatory protein
MPVYEYKCSECGHKFEIRRSMEDGNREIKCPACGKEDAQRMFSSFAKGTSSEACASNSST